MHQISVFIHDKSIFEYKSSEFLIKNIEIPQIFSFLTLYNAATWNKGREIRMLFTDKASGNLFILMSARINKRKLYLCKKMGVFTIAKVVSSEKCNIILELLSKKRVVYWFPSSKKYIFARNKWMILILRELMKRKIIQQLKLWKDNPARKPLILLGFGHG